MLLLGTFLHRGRQETTPKESALGFLRKDEASLQKTLPFKSLVLTNVFRHIEGRFPTKMVDWEPNVVF